MLSNNLTGIIIVLAVLLFMFFRTKELKKPTEQTLEELTKSIMATSGGEMCIKTLDVRYETFPDNLGDGFIHRPKISITFKD
jgi:Fe2+ transport system protein B